MKKQHLTQSEIMRKYADLITEAESTPAIPQQSLKAAAQKVAQTLTPEEQKQLQAIIAQVGKNPQAIAQAIGITPQDAQAAVQEGYMAEATDDGSWGIAYSLKGKLLQALHLAVIGVAGAVVADVLPDATQVIPAIGVIALMASDAVWGQGIKNPPNVKKDEQTEGFSNYDGTELNFYHVVVDFLIEANTPEEAARKVKDYNFAKVLERDNGWHNFDVVKVKQTRDVI